MFGRIKRNKKSAKLSQTTAIQARAAEAQKLELKKMALKREMEKVVVEYAKLTGFTALKFRRYKLGQAPNDWRKNEHRLDGVCK